MEETNPNIPTERQTNVDPVKEAAGNLRAVIADRSFSGRHPELGKMVNCPVCLLRHRSSVVCKERVLTPTANTRKGHYGAASFAKKRLKPHHSQGLLQLVQLTQQLFPKYSDQIVDPEKAMKAARGEARQILLRKIRHLRGIQNQIKHESRKANRGL